MHSNLRVHVVAFDVPYPPNYGGVIDVFYKIKALHEAGVRVVLHAFQYGRPGSDELEEVCEQVYFYSRDNSSWLFLKKAPFIVSSRRNPMLLTRLLADDAPILFEGLHCASFLNHPALKHRHKVLRTHNLEHEYYRALAKASTNWRLRKYFNMEARRLKRFEQVLHHAKYLACISPADTDYFQKTYGKAHHISAFHPFDEVEVPGETKPYVMYHGNLTVSENNHAALWLVKHVFSKLDVPFKIMGNGADEELREQVRAHRNVQLIEGLSTEEMYGAIREAHINLLPTFQATGIKLKLLTALHIGHHCVVNTPMIQNTGLESLCTVADTPEEIARTVTQLMNEPFSPDVLSRRKEVLSESFQNAKWAEKLIRLLFPDRPVPHSHTVEFEKEISL